MAYITLAQVKDYLDIGADADDVLLQVLIDSAQKWIEMYCGRSFEASTDTRYFEKDALDDDGKTLVLDADLLTITTLTNGDSASTAITSTDYWLVDRNDGPPYWGIRLKSDTTTVWEWDTDGWVTVTGTWGYSATADNAVKHACKRMVGYLYAQKDASVFDVTALPDAGVIQIPQGMPRDVKLILAPYVRKVG